MKISDISPKPQQKRTKGYSWELGNIAFGNPLDEIGKSAKIRKKLREHWAKEKKQTGGDKARNNYHRKHG